MKAKEKEDMRLAWKAGMDKDARAKLLARHRKHRRWAVFVMAIALLIGSVLPAFGDSPDEPLFGFAVGLMYFIFVQTQILTLKKLDKQESDSKPDGAY